MTGRSRLTGTLECVYGKVTECIGGEFNRLRIGEEYYVIREDEYLKYSLKEGWWQIVTSSGWKEIVGFVEKF